jgi:hypothetical protein
LEFAANEVNEVEGEAEEKESHRDEGEAEHEKVELAKPLVKKRLYDALDLCFNL